MHISPIQLKIIPFAVAAMLGGFATSAMATPKVYPNAAANPSITLDATYSLGGGALVDGMTDPVANIREQADGADFYLFKSGGSPNNVFFHTYGYTGSTTYFGARASGQGQFFGNTRATFSQTFTNTSSSAQVYNFSFMVDQGDLGLRGAGAGFADLLLNVKKDDVTVAQDHTRVEQNLAGDVVCSDTDIGLTNANGAYMKCANGAASNAFGSGGMFSVNMGVINAGDSFTLDYDIIATVSGDLSAGNSTIYQACNNGYGEEGEFRGDGDFNLALIDDDEPVVDPDAQVCSFQSSFPGSAIARSGDPFNGPQFAGNGPSAANVNSFMVTNSPATVPEPGSIALMGLALAGLAATRRKKSQHQG